RTDAGEPAARLAVRLDRGAFRLDVDLAWDERVVVIFGPSGAGKSTLLEAALGLHPEADCRVRLGGAWLEDPERGARVAVEERRLGWVPQAPTLFPHLDVADNLRFGLARGDAAALARAIEVLELNELLGRRVDALSGGEQQRVAIGRALASGPRALLLEEPLASLDLGLRARVLRHLLHVRDDLGLPILAITHDPDEALLLAERVVVIDGGREVASGAPAEVLWSRAVLPLSEALGLENVYEGRVAGATSFESDAGLGLVLPLAAEPGERICVGIRSEDVLLAADPPGRISARNALAARVTRCERNGSDVFVHLATDQGGEHLVAKITAAAAEKLALHEGMRLHAVIKAQSLRRIA
ncbi:MAG: molybdenum ABC transporter ATP-binding protein, partial [Myxococcota bacterium]